MKIKFWGTRGSISAPGKQRIKYGGHTTCLSIQLSDNTMIIIDGGTGIKDLSDHLKKKKFAEKEINVLMTHSHWDHIIGFPFFLPVYFAKYTLNIYGTSHTNNNLKKLIAHVWEPPFFPVPFESLQAKFKFHRCRKPFTIGSAKISTIRLNHPDGGLGYKIEDNNKTFVFLTDNELSASHFPEYKYDDYVDFIRDCDLLVHDGQYTKKEYKITKGWGHSVCSEVYELALKGNVKQVLISHHDYNHSDKDIDGFVNKGKEFFKKKKSRIKAGAAMDGLEVVLH